MNGTNTSKNILIWGGGWGRGWGEYIVDKKDAQGENSSVSGKGEHFHITGGAWGRGGGEGSGSKSKLRTPVKLIYLVHTTL